MKSGAEKSPSGEFVLGAEATGSHACYMIYGVLKPGESGRVAKPGRGHEELLLAARGDLELSGHFSGLLREGEAIHLQHDEECRLRNPGTEEAVYVLAGGHSSAGHHHHHR